MEISACLGIWVGDKVGQKGKNMDTRKLCDEYVHSLDCSHSYVKNAFCHVHYTPIKLLNKFHCHFPVPHCLPQGLCFCTTETPSCSGSLRQLPIPCSFQRLVRGSVFVTSITYGSHASMKNSCHTLEREGVEQSGLCCKQEPQMQ